MAIYSLPYTYLIGWSQHRKFYYGVRFAKNCHPDDLWVKYFTSSKHVKAFRQQHGEPDIIQVRYLFDSIDHAKDWEHRVLRRIHAVQRSDFLNRTDNKCRPNNKGLKRSEEFKQNLSRQFKGRRLTEEHRHKIAMGNSGPRPASFGAAVSAAMTGMKLTEEHKRNIGKAQTGKKRSAETAEAIRRGLIGKKHSPERVAKMREAVRAAFARKRISLAQSC